MQAIRNYKKVARKAVIIIQGERQAPKCQLNGENKVRVIKAGPQLQAVQRCRPSKEDHSEQPECFTEFRAALHSHWCEKVRVGAPIVFLDKDKKHQERDGRKKSLFLFSLLMFLCQPRLLFSGTRRRT